MDADADYGGKERVVLLPVYPHAVEPIVIENPVVDPFSGCALVIDFLISLCAAGNICIQADIPVRSCFDDPSVFSRGTGTAAFCCMFFTERTAPHEISGAFIISVWEHGEPGTAQGSAVAVDPDGVRDGLWPSAFVVEVNKSTDVAGFQ